MKLLKKLLCKLLKHRYMLSTWPDDKVTTTHTKSTCMRCGNFYLDKLYTFVPAGEWIIKDDRQQQ